MRIIPIGDCGIKVELAKVASPQLNQKIQSICRFLEDNRLDGVIEWAPTYTGITVYYHPIKLSFHSLSKHLAEIISKSESGKVKKGRLVTIPVAYGGQYGPDMTEVANYHQKSEEGIIKIHTKTIYLVYMIGFTPGFPYLGDLNEEIATPRKATPRTFVSAGSVGIGGNQTGIYSLDAPGGWQIIGRTPLELFSPKKQVPALLRSGDRIRFESITETEFVRIQAEVQAGRYIEQIVDE